MTLLQVINTIQKISSVQPNIHSFVGEFLALNDVTAKYSAIILQQRTHRRNNDFMIYSFYLGYADRLNEDKSNEVEVQSTAIQVIDDIVYKLENLNFDCTVGVYNTFTQRFLAEAAGGYVELDIVVPMGECEDDFAEEKLDTTITANGEYNFIPKGLGFQSVHLNVDVAHLQDKSLDITKNGNYKVQYDKGYSGLKTVDVNVNIDTQSYYDNGYLQGKIDGKTEGIAEQKAKLTDIEIVKNGVYERTDGYKKVEVNVPSPVIDLRETEITPETTEQIITPDGFDGYNRITVKGVDSSIDSDIKPENIKSGVNILGVEGNLEGVNNQEKSITITENGQTDITPDTNYTGLSRVGVNVNIDTQSYYDNGYSQGKIDGKTEGIAEQKAKLTDINITQNGTYTKEDGYKNVVVNVPIPEVNNQEKSITINSNGTSSVVPDAGYTGISKVDITVNVPTSGGDGIDLTSLGYTAQENTKINTDIQDSITYSQSLLESYTDDTTYESEYKMMFAPLFPCGNRNSFYKFFYQCFSLISIPALDTSKGTDFGKMFEGCDTLTSVPALNTSNGTNFHGMFVYCDALTSVPALDTSKGTNFSFMFDRCDALTSVPALNTSNGTNFNGMFYYCRSLTSVPSLDTSKGTDFVNMFYECKNLKNITFEGSINANISFYYTKILTYNSIKSILTACAATTNTNSKTVSFTRTIADQNNELTNLVATCTSKGWTVSGLTITTA